MMLCARRMDDGRHIYTIRWIRMCSQMPKELWNDLGIVFQCNL